MKRTTVLSVVTALCLGLSQPAIACVPSPGWPEQVKIDRMAMARSLVDAAETVDIVVAERSTQDFEVATEPGANSEAMANFAHGFEPESLTSKEVSARLYEDWREDGARIHYRVVERLKGPAKKDFSLNGVVQPPSRSSYRSPPEPKRKPVDMLVIRLDSRDLSAWPGFGACITPLWTTIGNRYLVFRDARGSLLMQAVSVRFRGEAVRVQGPVYAEVFSANDSWLRAVRRAATALPR